MKNFFRQAALLPLLTAIPHVWGGDLPSKDTTLEYTRLLTQLFQKKSEVLERQIEFISLSQQIMDSRKAAEEKAGCKLDEKLERCIPQATKVNVESPKETKEVK